MAKTELDQNKLDDGDDFTDEPLPDVDDGDELRSRLGRRSGQDRRSTENRRKQQTKIDFPERRIGERRDPIDRRVYDRRPGDVY